MNADPHVMEFFPRPWSLSESQTILQKSNFGFDERTFTAAINSRSIRVMERLRMKREEDFEHPTVTDARLKRHVLYRATAELFLSSQGLQTT